MGQTAFEKLAEYHQADAPPDRPVRAGDYLSIWPRRVVTHRNTSAVLRRFRSFGASRIRAPRQPVICWGREHGGPPRPDLRREAEAFAREHGLVFLGEAMECGLRFMIDRGYVLPGSFVAASDPHAALVGAVGAVGAPIVRTDAAMIWATGEFWWQVPESVELVLTGFLGPGVDGGDVLHALRRIYDRREVHHRVVECVGSGVASLSMEDRFRMASGAVEWGAVSAWFPVDGVTREYFEGQRRGPGRRGTRRVPSGDLEEMLRDPVGPDPDARYAARIRLDLSKVDRFAKGTGVIPDSLRNLEPWPSGGPPAAGPVEILEGFPERLRGRLVFLAVDDVDTRAICGDAGDVEDPTADSLARKVLDRVDPGFAAATRTGDVLVAGYQFGSGPSREEAATVFLAKGFSALVAGSLAPAFRRHALNNGLIALECPALVDRLSSVLGSGAEGLVVADGESLEIEFATSRIRWRGESFAFPPFTRVPQLVVAARGVEHLLRQGAPSG